MQFSPFLSSEPPSLADPGRRPAHIHRTLSAGTQNHTWITHRARYATIHRLGTSVLSFQAKRPKLGAAPRAT
eukprot:4163965-Alexandrium_andersonii.AAC.1